MASKINGNQKHLREIDREYIEAALSKGLTFKEIAKFLSKDPTTISKEIKKHRLAQQPNLFTNKNRCLHRKGCGAKCVCGLKSCDHLCRNCIPKDCNLFCRKFIEDICVHVARAPYVCNGCDRKVYCRLQKYYYRAHHSQTQYLDTLSSTRQGINLCESELADLDTLVTPLLKNGQSLAHIYAKHNATIPCTSRTLYNYSRKSILTARPLDFPRVVKYKKRRKQAVRSARNPAIRSGRTYEDFRIFLLENSGVSVVEMDTVIGRIGGKVLLTMLFRNSRFQLAFLMDHNTQQQVFCVFDQLESDLGEECFRKLFPAILTDNGAEFLDPVTLETGARTKIFFCDPNAPFQKGAIEKNHEFIRYILPKGTSFDSLTQEDVNLMLNHINCTARDSLNGVSPFDLATLLLGSVVLEKLNMHRIEHDEVLLKPKLLKKKSETIKKENS